MNTPDKKDANGVSGAEEGRRNPGLPRKGRVGEDDASRFCPVRRVEPKEKGPYSCGALHGAGLGEEIVRPRPVLGLDPRHLTVLN
jgi:hypothetical protein